MQPSPIVQAQHLSYEFISHDNHILVLQDLNLTILAGEQVAIVGCSGSGKSTLLSLLAGLDVPTQGSVQIQNKPFSALDEDGRAAIRAKNMGFVFQSFQLLPSLTALENVMLPLQLKNHPNAKTLSLEALSKVGLSARVQHYPCLLYTSLGFLRFNKLNMCKLNLVRMLHCLQAALMLFGHPTPSIRLPIDS